MSAQHAYACPQINFGIELYGSAYKTNEQSNRSIRAVYKYQLLKKNE